MGIIVYGPLAQEVAGTVGGVTFARAHDVKTCRGWRAPVNKRRPLQISARQRLAFAASRWFNTLTQTMRDNWDIYAATCEFTNSLGDTYYISGFNMYVRTIAACLAYDVDTTDTAPISPGFPTSYAIDFSFTRELDSLYISGIEPLPTEGTLILYVVHASMPASRKYPNTPRIAIYKADLTNEIPIILHEYDPDPPDIYGYLRAVCYYHIYDADNRLSIKYVTTPLLE